MDFAINVSQVSMKKITYAITVMSAAPPARIQPIASHAQTDTTGE